MQVINNIVIFTAAESGLFELMGLAVPGGQPAEQALLRIQADIVDFVPADAISAVNLRILERIHNTLAVMTGNPEIEPRSL